MINQNPNYYKNNITELFKFIGTLDANKQLEALSSISFKEDHFFLFLLGTENQNLLHLALSNKVIKEKIFQQENIHGFLLSTIFKSKDWEKTLLQLLNCDFFIKNTPIKESGTFFHFIHEIGSCISDNPTLEPKIISFLERNLQPSHLILIKKDINQILDNLACKKNCDNLFKYMICIDDGCNHVNDYKEHMFLNVVEKNPKIFIKHYQPDKFSAFGEEHPFKKSFYNIINIMNKNKSVLNDVDFANIFVSAIHSSNLTTDYLDNLADLQIEFKLGEALQKKNQLFSKVMWTKMFYYYVCPLWEKLTVKDHLDNMLSFSNNLKFPLDLYIHTFIKKNNLSIGAHSLKKHIKGKDTHSLEAISLSISQSNTQTRKLKIL